MKTPSLLFPPPGSTASRAMFGAIALAVSVASVVDLGHSPVASVNDKFEHVLAFMVLGASGGRAFPDVPRVRVLLPALAGFGLLIECVQWSLPWREFSLLDLAADLAGILTAFGAERWLAALNRARTP